MLKTTVPYILCSNHCRRRTMLKPPSPMYSSQIKLCKLDYHKRGLYRPYCGQTPRLKWTVIYPASGRAYTAVMIEFDASGSLGARLMELSPPISVSRRSRWDYAILLRRSGIRLSSRKAHIYLYTICERPPRST